MTGHVPHPPPRLRHAVGRWTPGSSSIAASGLGAVTGRTPLASPRCGKAMTRYEAVNGPMLEDPVCGRPEGHQGRCRSEAALARKYAADVARIGAVRREYGWRYGRSAAA